MTADRWRQIEDLYHAAQLREPGEREGLLECADPEIRARVEQMLALDSEGLMLDQPAAALLDGAPKSPTAVGTRLGPYKLEGSIGAGGMGIVYRAVDTRLGRSVAIKIADDFYSERFQAEAEAISTLNHPHICTLFDVGPNYLVMELLEGQTLKERIASGGFSTQELLSIAIPVSDALDAAHSRGIIHRDIKPGNIFLNERGIVKILDFGLAKTVGPYETGRTDTSAYTQSSSAVGTVSYMSPEQARGGDLDARTDLFSLGVVLYEMAAGQLPFTGADWTDIRDAIMSRSPRPARELNSRLTPELGRIIDKALQKDRGLRYQSASDLHADLLRASQAVPAATKGGFRYLALITLALLTVAGASWLSSPKMPVTNPAEYVQLTNFADSATAPALSRDGKMVTFIRGSAGSWNTGQIYVKSLPDGPATQLSNEREPRYGPVFTPDGSRVAYTHWFRSGSTFSWDTVTVPVSGGPSELLLSNASGLSWIDDHRVLFSQVRSGIHMGIVTATDRRADLREIYFPLHERGMAHYSYLSPDHKSILIVEMDRAGAFQRCRLTPFDGSSPGRQVGPQGTCMSAGWSPDGKWMYFAAIVDGKGHLWRQRYPDGTPEQITFGATEEEGIAVAADGRSIVTSLGIRQSAVWIHQNDGDRAICSDGFSYNPHFSYDGKRVYYLSRGNSAASGELYSVDLASGAVDRLLPGVWMQSYDISLDGKQVVFTRHQDGTDSQIWTASLDRLSAPRLITRGGDSAFFGSGREVIFRRLGEAKSFLFRIGSDGKGLQRIFDMPVLDLFAVSPDGEWIIAATPQNQVTTPFTFALPVHGGAPRVICHRFCHVRWSPGGRYLYIMLPGGGPSGKTFAVPLPPGWEVPNLPPTGIDLAGVPGAFEIDRPLISPGPDPSTYVFTETRLQRNLFRIPLH